MYAKAVRHVTLLAEFVPTCLKILDLGYGEL
jgi:hypothetical protein